MKKLEVNQVIVCSGVPSGLDYKRYRVVYDYKIPSGEYIVVRSNAHEVDQDTYGTIIRAFDIMYRLKNTTTGEEYLLPSNVYQLYDMLGIMQITPAA